MSEKSYHYVTMPINRVMDNIEQFIIPENRRAINYLWDKNILTVQTNNYDNEDSWINIGKLSEENSKIFWNFANTSYLLRDNDPKIGLVGNGIGFRVPIVPGTMDTFEAFKPLIDVMKMQDVQKDGYMTIEEFYIKCTDCHSIVDNPNYHPLLKPKERDYPDAHSYSAAYDQYVESVLEPRHLLVFDSSKCVKDFDEYLKEAGLLGCFDQEEGKIFLNKRLYEGHMRYKKMMGKGKIKSI